MPVNGIIGTRLGEYVIKEYIDNGAFGYVYLSEHNVTHEKVATKILNPENSMGSHLRLFDEEKRLMKNLDHRRFVRVIDMGDMPEESIAPGIPYIHMEYMKEGNLRDYVEGLEEDPTLERDPFEILRIMDQTLEGMGYLHRELRTLHRDVHPGNILFDEQRNVKISDFGLAKPIDRTGASMYTSLGRRSVQAPELYRNGKATELSEIWVLGALFKYMCIGIWEPIAHTPEKIDNDLEALIRKAQEYRPQDRYQSVQEMREDVHKIWERREYAQLEEEYGPRFNNILNDDSSRNFREIYENAGWDKFPGIYKGLLAPDQIYTLHEMIQEVRQVARFPTLADKMDQTLSDRYEENVPRIEKAMREITRWKGRDMEERKYAWFSFNVLIDIYRAYSGKPPIDHGEYYEDPLPSVKSSSFVDWVLNLFGRGS